MRIGSISVDAGYVALVVMLIIVPVGAVLTAVVDRLLYHRRLGARKASSPNGAFPVLLVSIPPKNDKPEMPESAPAE